MVDQGAHEKREVARRLAGTGVPAEFGSATSNVAGGTGVRPTLNSKRPVPPDFWATSPPDIGRFFRRKSASTGFAPNSARSRPNFDRHRSTSASAGPESTKLWPLSTLALGEVDPSRPATMQCLPMCGSILADLWARPFKFGELLGRVWIASPNVGATWRGVGQHFSQFGRFGVIASR